MESEKSIYKPGVGVTITCYVKGKKCNSSNCTYISFNIIVYPATNVKWLKKYHRQTGTEILDSDPRLRIESYQKSQTELVSRLIIPEVEEADTAAYSCHVGKEHKVATEICDILFQPLHFLAICDQCSVWAGRAVRGSVRLQSLPPCC